ncbi:hypothetical protein [Marinobacter halotolerans]|uniref:hypothetical protein n=1 Tax=Marinobacter halotolerans TaxID=1569211 RepID=UPI0012474170|nr:hypothetical protein [Marinobacter halotolerans]
MAGQRLRDSGGLKSARWFRNLVAVILLFVLLWFLLDALERELQRAEEQAVALVLSQLRSALVVKGAEVMLDQHASLAEQEGINPFELMTHQWANYAGQCGGDRPEPGVWCFRERTQKETVKPGRGWLIYNPKQPMSIQSRQTEGDEPLAWKVETQFSDRNGNGQREKNERLTGLRMVPVSLTERSANASSEALR